MICSNTRCSWYSDAAKDNCKGVGYLVDRVVHCRDFIWEPPTIQEKIVEKEVVKPKTTNILSHIRLEDLE